MSHWRSVPRSTDHRDQAGADRRRRRCVSHGTSIQCRDRRCVPPVLAVAHGAAAVADRDHRRESRFAALGRNRQHPAALRGNPRHPRDGPGRARRAPRALQASVCGVPHAFLAGGQSRIPDPDPNANMNVLMLHGDVHGRGLEAKLRYISEYGGASIDAQADPAGTVGLRRARPLPRRDRARAQYVVRRRHRADIDERVGREGVERLPQSTTRTHARPSSTRSRHDRSSTCGVFRRCMNRLRGNPGDAQIGNGQSIALDDEVPPRTNGNGQKPTLQRRRRCTSMQPTSMRASSC